MNKRLLFAPLLLSLLLAACGGDNASDAATDPAADAANTAAADTTSTAPADGAAAPALVDDAVADEPATGDLPSDPTAPVPPGASDRDAAADGADAAPAADAATADAELAAAQEALEQGPPLVAGVDYVEIPGGQPFAPLEGKVEVVEVFAYSCGACAAFDPLVEAWKRRQPSHVRFTYLPAVFYDQDNFPKAYFAAEAIGVADDLHSKFFNALHIERSLRPNSSADDIIAWMAKQGADAGQLRGTIDSFAVKAKVARTKQFIVRTGIDATPTVVVNGKYRVRGRSLEDVLDITDRLVARERVAAAQASGGH